jgi:hypothetical protein
MAIKKVYLFLQKHGTGILLVYLIFKVNTFLNKVLQQLVMQS